MFNARICRVPSVARLAYLRACTLFVGGIYVVRPLLAVEGLQPGIDAWLNYYCWHMTTLHTAGHDGDVCLIRPYEPERPRLRHFVDERWRVAFSALCIARRS